MNKYKVESGVQLLARLTKKPVVENFYSDLFQPGLKCDDVVELISNSSQQLLLDLISEAIYPKNNTEPLGALVFNTASHFNCYEFINVLKKKIVSTSRGNCETELENVLKRSLNNLFTLDIYDATQFYTSIHNLDNILAEHPNISLLIFNTLTAFYWSEQGSKITKMDLYIKNLLKMIQKVAKEYKVILIYTKPEHFSSNKETYKIGDVPMPEDVNYKVQILDSISNTYQVNVRTIDCYYEKNMFIINNKIKWQ
ncbi:DNA repair protein XRCC2-like [Helicoverpa armigera]|uniref:DNA repair protein XRCC2-like n=1 Tax=Helicoverpa armigera TaxID=29058 RepID=UPI00308361C1